MTCPIPRRATSALLLLVACCGGGRASTTFLPHEQTAAQAYMWSADPEAASAALSTSLDVDPENPLLLTLAGDLAYFRGDFPLAMDLLGDAVRAAPGWESPLRDSVAEMALSTIDSMDIYAPDFDEKLAAIHEDSLARLYTNTDAAYFVALKSRISSLARAGRFDDAKKMVDEGGCLTHWQVAGPFGETELLHYDTEHQPEADVPWQSSYVTRPGLAPISTYEAEGVFCRVYIEPDDVLAGGTFYAATDLSIHRGGPLVFRLASAYTTSIIIDGVTVIEVDRRQDYAPSVILFTVDLSAGEHRLMVKLGARDPMPDFSLMVKEASSGRPDPSLPPAVSSRRHGQGFSSLASPPAPASTLGPGEPRSELESFLAAEIALIRGDTPRARALLEPMAAGHASSAMLSLRMMNVELTDPFIPYALRMNRLRVIAEQVVMEHPSLWPTYMLLARLEMGQDRTEEAIEALLAGIELAGDLAPFHSTLADLYASKGWVGESIQELESTATLLVGNCEAARDQLDIAEVFGDLDAMETCAREVVACDATDTSLYEILMNRSKYEEAAEEQARLQQLFPDRDTNLLDKAAMAEKLGDHALYVANLTAFHDEHPTSYMTLGRLVDEHLAAGNGGEAVALLERARTILDGPTDDISMMIAFIEGYDYLYPFRRDAFTAIAAYEAQVTTDTAPGTPSVEILDHVTHRIFRDGSSLTRYHSVRKVLSKEGVELNSEFIAPPGASVIQLRTIKADGRVLTPEDVANKMTLSFPSLEPGDYTETEWLQAVGPSLIYTGGFSLDRWYFQILDLVLYLSEMIVVAPADMALEIDARGTPPPMETFDAGPLTVMRWTANAMPHMKGEPDVPNLSEFLPSLQLSHASSWDRFFEWIADMLVDGSVPSPRLVAQVNELVADIPEKDVGRRARAIFRWVNDEIDDGEGIDMPVAYILEERMGDRSRLLHAMLEQAGVPSELWMVSTAYSDHTVTDVPGFGVYTELVVRVGDDWLLPFADSTPYGALPFDVRGEKAVRLFPSPAKAVTPGQDAFDDGHIRKLMITVGPGGRSEARMVETYRGINAAMMRTGLEQLPKSDLENAIETSYLSAMFNGASLTDLTLPDLDDDSEEMTLELCFTLPAMPGPVPGTIALGPFLKSYLSKIWTQLPERKLPLLVSEPTNEVVEVVIETGGNWMVLEPPAPSTSLSTAGGASFSQVLTEDDTIFTLDREVHLPAGRVSPEDYQELLEFTTQVDEVEGGVYILLRTKPDLE